MWEYLVQHAQDYGFLGPIVGIVGVLLGASSAIYLGWARSMDTFKPPEDFVQPLSRVVTVLCAIGMFVAWVLAEPANGAAYLRAAIYLGAICGASLVIYVGLMAYCAFKKKDVKPTQFVWGGFWLTKRARDARRKNQSVKTFLAGNLYDVDEVWPRGSLTAAAVVIVLTLLVLLVSGTTALSTAATAIQVALTQKPARQVFSASQVPGLPQASPSPALSPTPSPSSKPSPSPSPSSARSRRSR